jgi:hypothetical protein
MRRRANGPEGIDFSIEKLERSKMPYANPKRSPYCAARHLLRHLGNPSALRRNPFVTEALGIELGDDDLVCAVRTLVDRAFRRMDASWPDTALRHRARHAAILLRCDVFRESRAAIARDLDLSLPQFERERRVAMSRFLDHFQSARLAEIHPAATVQNDLASLVRRRAMRLADSGDARSARRLLDDIARTASRAEKVRALICTSEIASNDHDIARSRTALDAAAHALGEERANDGERQVLWLAHETAALRLSSVEGGPQAAAKSLRCRADLPPGAESIALLIAQAETLDGCGTVGACRPLVARALELLPSVPDIDPAIAVDIMFMQSQMEFWLNSSVRGRAGLDSAVSAARAAGYAGRALFGELSHLGGQWARTRDGRTRRDYRALLERIGRATELPKQTRFFAYWDAADVECGIGDPWRAAEAARQALALAPNASRALVIQGLLARVYARGGRPGKAESVALEIIGHPSGSHTGLALLLAKRTLADVGSASGRPRQTWESLQDAAGLARRFGTARLAAELDERLSRFRFHRF